MATKYANLAVRESEATQISQLETTIANPVAWAGIPNKEKFTKELKNRKAKLDRITPPDLKGDAMLEVKRRQDLLTQALQDGKSGVVPPMPTRRQMEQAPAGAVDQHLNFEMFWKRHNLDSEGRLIPVNTRAGQQNILHEWKDGARALGKAGEEWSPNVANLEMIRRENDHVPLADTVLPRSYGLSLAAKENYDKVFTDREPLPVERKIERKTRTSKNPCTAISKNGQPCKANARIESPFCVFHQPKKFEPVLDAPILAAPITG